MLQIERRSESYLIEFLRHSHVKELSKTPPKSKNTMFLTLNERGNDRKANLFLITESPREPLRLPGFHQHDLFIRAVNYKTQRAHGRQNHGQCPFSFILSFFLSYDHSLLSSSFLAIILSLFRSLFPFSLLLSSLLHFPLQLELKARKKT